MDRNSPSSLPSVATQPPTTSTPTPDTPSSKGQMGDKEVTQSPGQPLVSNYEDQFSLTNPLPATMLRNREIRHVRAVRFLVRLAALFSGVSNVARAYVISRSQDLAATLIDRKDPKSLRSAHQLLDNLARYQTPADKELPLWRCKAYDTLSATYQGKGNQASQTRVAASVVEILPLLDVRERDEYAGKVATLYKSVVEDLDDSASLPALKQACNFVADIGPLSPDWSIDTWQKTQAKKLVQQLLKKDSAEHKEQAVHFVKQMEVAFENDISQRSFMAELKLDADPRMYAFDDLRDVNSETTTLTANNARLPAKMIAYGHNGDLVRYQFERLSGTMGATSLDHPGYTEVKLHGATIPVKSGAPISQEDCELVAKQQYSARVKSESQTIGAGAEASRLISELSPDVSDRILFCTDINDSPHSQQWQEDLRHFTIAMNSSKDSKAEDWNRVRFVITCPKPMNSRQLERRRWEVIDQVNAQLEPLNLQLDDSFFAMQSHNPDYLPEQRRKEFANLFPNPN